MSTGASREAPVDKRARRLNKFLENRSGPRAGIISYLSWFCMKSLVVSLFSQFPLMIPARGPQTISVETARVLLQSLWAAEAPVDNEGFSISHLTMRA